MSTSIRVSDDTNRMLERLMREAGTFNELLERLGQSEEPIQIGARNEADGDRARVAVKRSRESIGR